MCGRLNVTADPLTQLLMDVFGIEYSSADALTEDHNIAPTQSVAVLRRIDRRSERFQLQPLRWWLIPSWASEINTKYAMFNAKAETLGSKPAFARLFRAQRCVVPVSGFYEWSTNPLGSNDLAGPVPTEQRFQKQPYLISAAEQPGLLLAGLWDRWESPAGDEVVESFSIVTTAANSGMEFLHKRQPVMLDAQGARQWLDAQATPEQLQELLAPHLPVALQLAPVSNQVNNARNKQPEITMPIGPSIEVHPDYVTH